MSRWLLLSLVGVALLAGCQTPADQWFTNNLSPKEKASFLVDLGIDRYNKMVDDDALDRIPQVKAIFQLAVTTWPQEPRAADWIKKVDGFKAKRQNEVQSRAKSLAAKPNLTDKEQYDLVLLVYQLQILAPPDVDLTKLTAQVAPVRALVLRRYTQALNDDEAALTGAKTDAAMTKSIGLLHTTIDDLLQIDPSSPAAAASSKRLSEIVAEKTRVYLDQASKAYQAKDYPGTLKTLSVVEDSLSGFGAQITGEVTDLHYKTCFDWAKDLFSAKRYGEAGTRINEALTIRLTPEAKDLKDKISAAALFRDYDAEYDTIDRQIDSLIKSGDLKTAWAQVVTTATQLKKDATKAKLDQRRKQVLDAVHALYDSAVSSYNEEDYQEAKTGFDTVMAVDPTWLLAKAYQDKAKAKLQALGGK